MSDVPAHELYSLLVPLAQERLIVPRACVAEVLPWQVPTPATQPAAQALPWYLGTLTWSGREVPVISFEAACGQPVPVPGSRSRIAVFVALAQRLTVGYFAVLTQGFPQLVRVNGDVVKADPSRRFSERGPVLCQVRMLNESPLIPDMHFLEDLLGQVQRAA